VFPSFILLCTLVRWYTRVHYFFMHREILLGFFLSKQIGTPNGTWFSSYLCCATMVVVFTLMSYPLYKWWSRWCYFRCHSWFKAPNNSPKVALILGHLSYFFSGALRRPKIGTPVSEGWRWHQMAALSFPW
jgi:uncharacterized membrane protein